MGPYEKVLGEDFMSELLGKDMETAKLRGILNLSTNID